MLSTDRKYHHVATTEAQKKRYNGEQGYLATVTDPEEHNAIAKFFLRNYYSPTETTYVFLAGSDVGREGII